MCVQTVVCAHIHACIHKYTYICARIHTHTHTPIQMWLLVWLQLNEALNSLFCLPALSFTEDEPVATTRRNDREKVTAMQVSHVMRTHTHTYVHYIFMAVYVCVSSVWETKHMINELLILLGPNKGYDFPLPPSPCCHVIIIVVVPLPPPLGLRASALLSSNHLLATMPQTNCMKMKTLHDARVQGRNKMLWAKLCGKTATGQNNDRKRWRIKQNTKSNNNKNKGHF